MLRTHVYLPEELSREINYIAKVSYKSKAEVIRRALADGLRMARPQKSSSAKALLEMVREAKNFKGTAPKDLAYNHDYYTWGGEKKKPETGDE